MIYGLGARFSPIDKNDFAITKFTPEQLDKNKPVPEVSAKYRQQHIDNQGSTSLCSAYTICNKVTTRIFQRTGEYVLLSPAYTYGNRENMSYKGEGMNGRDTQQGARKSGFIRRDNFPIEKGTYETCNTTFSKKADLYKEQSIAFRTDGFARLNDVYEVAQYIQQEEVPVWGAFTVYENIRSASSSGIIEQPSGAIKGGHAVNLHDVVYKNGQPYIKFANSWGTIWGDDGWGYLPANMLREAWGDFDRPPLADDNAPTEFIVFLKDIDDNFNTKRIWTNSNKFTFPDEIKTGAKVDGYKIVVTQGKASGIIEDRTMILLRPMWEAIGWEVNWMGDYVTITKGKTEGTLRKELGLE